MNQIKVSIVMPCYNAEKTVEYAINSILDQTYPHFELILVNDGSIDKTKEILLNYQAKDPRIILIDHPINQGLAYSLNAAIKKARSPLILRMDADDWSYPDRISIQHKFMEEHPEVDILGTAVEMTEDMANIGRPRYLPETHSAIVNKVFQKPLVYHPSIIVRRKVFEQIAYYDPSVLWAEDADLWYKIYDRVTFHNLPQVLLRYKVKKSLSRKQAYWNLRVKYIHLKKRKKLIKYSGILLRDAVLFFVKMKKI